MPTYIGSIVMFVNFNMLPMQILYLVMARVFVFLTNFVWFFFAIPSLIQLQELIVSLLLG